MIGESLTYKPFSFLDTYIMLKPRRWPTISPVETKPVASPTFNTILDAKKAELSADTLPWDTTTDGAVKVITPSIKPKRDIAAELVKIATRKASSKEKATAPKLVKVKKITSIKPAKTVKAPVAKKEAPKTAPVKKAKILASVISSSGTTAPKSKTAKKKA